MTKANLDGLIRPRSFQGHRTWTDKKGRQHRLSGPAVELPNGDKIWFWRGQWKYEEAIAPGWMMRRRGVAKLDRNSEDIFNGFRTSTFDLDGKLKSKLHGYGKAKA